jgi:phosphodiesterase/alkaline phosphatase D-like protein
MPDLVIGHTTETSARIWVCGDKRHRGCRVAVRAGNEGAHQDVALDRRADRTGIATFDGLRPNTDYTVTATFHPAPKDVVKGRLRTFKRQRDNNEFAFSFVLSSCNLSVVSINNLLTYLLAFGGTSVAMTSLDIPKESWRYSKIALLRRLLRRPGKLLIGVAAKFVNWLTGLKQPSPPFLRSPFLKLVAVFDSRMVEVVAKEKCLPSVGDSVVGPRGCGVLACTPRAVIDSEHKNIKRDEMKADAPARPPGDEDECAKVDEDTKIWRLILTYVEGDFADREPVSRRAASSPAKALKPFGYTHCTGRCHPWYDAPSFFIHAGDQIYFDFPTEKLEPKADRYRLAYREAWFHDPDNRYLLSHWPHYMTLDDHELADQFSNDFNPPRKRTEHWFTKKSTYEDVATPETYLKEAKAAYLDYVHGRHSQEDSGRQRGEDLSKIPLWYSFRKGPARFFVLDTRTQRFDKAPNEQIIDSDQLNALCRWMSEDTTGLKFVVTSVPFVAEINEKGAEGAQQWSGQVEERSPKKRQPRNFPNDKWSADRFTAQRDRIINYIFDNNIERLIFLTGDMHCCYHATMRIGPGSKYATTVVHELAAGPVNQLQLANEVEFYSSRTRRTKRPEPERDRPQLPGVPYEVNLDQFHSQMNGVMHVKVNYAKRKQVDIDEHVLAPEVEWNVIRTLTDDGADAWAFEKEHVPGRVGIGHESGDPNTPKGGKPVMGGLITFSPRRALEQVIRWSLT